MTAKQPFVKSVVNFNVFMQSIRPQKARTMALKLEALPPDIYEKIFCYLCGEDIVSMSLASEVIRRFVEDSIERYKDILSFTFVCKRIENKAFRSWTRKSTVSRLTFATSSVNGKLAALRSIIEKILAAPVPWWSDHTLVVITGCLSEAHSVMVMLKDIGILGILSQGYPTKFTRNRFSESKTKKGLTAAVTPRPGGHWGFWPDHVVALNPPKTLEEHLKIEKIGGKVTWTRFGTSRNNFETAAKLMNFLERTNTDLEGPGLIAAHYSTQDCIDDSRNLGAPGPYRIAEARRIFSNRSQAWARRRFKKHVS